MSKHIKYQRSTPSTTINARFTASRQNTLRVAQDGILAELSLTYDEVFQINTAQFGTDLIEHVNAKVAEAVNWDAIGNIMIEAGCPTEIAMAVMDKAKTSINLNAGLNEAVREYGVAKFELPENFWGSDDSDEIEVKAEVVVVDMDDI